MSEEEIYRNALSDPDNPPLSDAELGRFVRARDLPGATVLEKLRSLKALAKNKTSAAAKTAAKF